MTETIEYFVSQTNVLLVGTLISKSDEQRYWVDMQDCENTHLTHEFISNCFRV